MGRGSSVVYDLRAIAGDAGWYDNGTAVTALFNHSWNIVPQDSRDNAIGYSLDGGSVTQVSRAGGGTFQVSIEMGSPHELSVSSVVQYFILGVGVTLTGSQTSDAWFDAGSQFTVQSAYTRSYTSGQHYVVNVAPNLMQVITRQERHGNSVGCVFVSALLIGKRPERLRLRPRGTRPDSGRGQHERKSALVLARR